MAEEQTTFQIEFDLQRARRDLGRIPGEAPRIPGFVPSKPPDTAKRRLPGQRDVGEATTKTRLEQLREKLRDRRADRTSKRREVAKDRRGGVRDTRGFVRGVFGAIPIVGAVAGAAGAFILAKAEVVRPAIKAIPGLDVLLATPGVGPMLDSLIDNAKNLKATAQSFGTTFSQITNIGKAFGAIGVPPAEDEALSLIPAIFLANRAQAQFRLDITESMLSESTSMWAKMAPRLIGESFTQLGKAFAPLTGFGE